MPATKTSGAPPVRVLGYNPKAPSVYLYSTYDKEESFASECEHRISIVTVSRVTIWKVGALPAPQRQMEHSKTLALVPGVPKHPYPSGTSVFWMSPRLLCWVATLTYLVAILALAPITCPPPAGSAFAQKC